MTLERVSGPSTTFGFKWDTVYDSNLRVHFVLVAKIASSPWSHIRPTFGGALCKEHCQLWFPCINVETYLNGPSNDFKGWSRYGLDASSLSLGQSFWQEDMMASIRHHSSLHASSTPGHWISTHRRSSSTEFAGLSSGCLLQLRVFYSPPTTLEDTFYSPRTTLEDTP